MPIQSVAELYAHAIAIEREAAERYAELAGRMQDEGRDDLARVFNLLARLESEHLEALEARTGLRTLAREMAAEEQEHTDLIERLLEATPEPQLASTVIFAK